MKKMLLLFALSPMAFACKQKTAQQDTKEQLENTMARFLEKNQAKQDTKLKFSVDDVNWFEERHYYDCVFKVKMTLPGGKDTTGTMKERVSKDFTTFDVPFNP